MPSVGTVGATGLIGAAGILLLTLLGLALIVRGLLGGMRVNQFTSSAPGGFGQGAFGRTVGGLLSFAVAYKFFFEGYMEKLYGLDTMLGAAVFALVAMTIVPAVETFVSIAALILFLMNNTAAFGGTAIATFFGLAVVFALARHILGR